MLHSIHNRRSVSQQGRKEELVHSMQYDLCIGNTCVEMGKFKDLDGGHVLQYRGACTNAGEPQSVPGR